MPFLSPFNQMSKTSLLQVSVITNCININLYTSYENLTSINCLINKTLYSHNPNFNFSTASPQLILGLFKTSNNTLNDFFISFSSQRIRIFIFNRFTSITTDTNLRFKGDFTEEVKFKLFAHSFSTS